MGMQRGQDKVKNSGTEELGLAIDALTRICDGLSIDDIESFETR